MQYFNDCDLIIEVGPGSKLSKMLKREWPEKEIYTLNSAADLEQLATRLGKSVEKTELATDVEQGVGDLPVESPVSESVDLKQIE
jgi:hypothetical protein